MSGNKTFEVYQYYKQWHWSSRPTNDLLISPIEFALNYKNKPSMTDVFEVLQVNLTWANKIHEFGWFKSFSYLWNNFWEPCFVFPVQTVIYVQTSKSRGISVRRQRHQPHPTSVTRSSSSHHHPYDYDELAMTSREEPDRCWNFRDKWKFTTKLVSQSQPCKQTQISLFFFFFFSCY